MKNREKKDLGNWGESLLDNYMEKKGWLPFAKNLRIKHGEIDRVYTLQVKKQGVASFCVCEIKTTVFYNLQALRNIYTEVGVKRYLKQRQIQNLYRYGENLMANLQVKGVCKPKIYLRFFILFKAMPFFKGMATLNLPHKGPVKTCFLSEQGGIFSIEPEFTPIGSRKSLLQIVI